MSDIKVGDYVKAEFETAADGVFEVHGTVMAAIATDALFLGRNVLVNSNGTLVATILERTPKRMDEPAWGEKVVAHTSYHPRRRAFIHASGGWWDESGALCPWSSLIDPQPIAPF